MSSIEIKKLPAAIELTVVPASSGGFVVWDETIQARSEHTFRPIRAPEFAGSLADCLEYVRKRFCPVEAERSVYDSSIR